MELQEEYCGCSTQTATPQTQNIKDDSVCDLACAGQATMTLPCGDSTAGAALYKIVY